MYIRNGIKLREDPRKQHSGYMPDVLSIVSGSRAVRVVVDDIEVVEQAGRVLHIITPDDDYTCFESIESIASLLEARGFYRSMKKVMINLDKVMEMSGNEITFMSGTTIVMGRNNFLASKKAFKEYMMQYPQFSLWKSTSGYVDELDRNNSVELEPEAI